MVDHFHCDAARLRLVEGPRSVAVESCPGFRIDFGFESGFERAVGIIRAEEVGVTDEEAFFVVVGVDEPAGDAIGSVADDFTGLGFEDIHAVHLDAQLAVWFGQEGDVRLSEDDEEVAFAGIFEVLGHVEVGIHAGLEHGDAAQLAELRGVRFVIEGAGDENIEAGITRLAGGGDKVGALDGAELGADEDGGALLDFALQVAAFGANQFAGPWRKGGEGDPILLVRLLHAGGLEVLQDHLGEGLLGSVFGACLP